MQLLKNIKRRNSFKKIDKGFKSQIGRIASLVASGKRNEEETRRWCIDVLKTAMGYKDSEIETESKVLGQRVDIALKNNGKVFLVIECKAATVKLNQAAINQAATYAVGLGAEWAVVTNGHNWMLYHVSPTKGIEPDVIEIFNVSILDEDGISEDDAYYLYLLTSESIFSGETKQAFHDINCLSYANIQAAINNKDVLNLICKNMEANYRKNMGVAVDVSPDEIAPFINEFFEAIITA
jgi:predicted type IV restriction endonuclease